MYNTVHKHISSVMSVCNTGLTSFQ